MREVESIALVIALAAAAGVPPALAADQSSSEVRPSALEEGDFEHTIVLGLGGAAEVELGSGSWHPGVNAFIEFEAIPNWLELELGVSVLHTLERPGALRRPVAQEAVSGGSPARPDGRRRSTSSCS